MKHSWITIFVVLLLARPASPADPDAHPLFEDPVCSTRPSQIDRHVQALLKEHRIESAPLCSDVVFVRRVYLDVIGTLPRPEEVRVFLESKRRNKRATLINELLERDEFADYWSLKWGDLLRVKAEYPINLWPNAVQAYAGWIHDSIAENTPYDQFARALLTSSGSNFRVPPVNFYRAMQGKEPSAIAAAVGLTFMGTRLEQWPDDRRHAMEAFFSRVAFKGTAEWKEEIVHRDPSTLAPMEVMFPDGTRAVIQGHEDPRRVFADWLIDAENEWFSRAIVNRIWAWLMGHGIIDEPDDIRADNPPTNPKLLAHLERALVKSDYDLKHIYRLILNSRTYQQSSIPRSDHPQAGALNAHYHVRQLEAEVLIDALCQICGPQEQYESRIPEPFTYIPERQRSIMLSDGSITSPFLELFGRPPRDTGLESERNNQPTNAQRLHMLNSTHVQQKIERSANIRQIQRSARNDPQFIIEALYLTILSRTPLPSELDIIEEHFESDSVDIRQAINDLVWALINTKEFLHRH